MMEQKSSLDQTSSESFFFFNPRTPCGVRQNERQNTGTVFVCNVTANMVKIDRKMANSPLNATPLHPHCNLVAPPLKTA